MEEVSEPLLTDSYFMTIAKMLHEQADGSVGNGLCVVDKNNRILAIGSWDRFPESWQAYRKEHSEDPDDAADGASVYTSEFPGLEFAREIAHSNIKSLVYDEDAADSLSALAAARILQSAGVVCRRYRRTGKRIAVSV